MKYSFLILLFSFSLVRLSTALNSYQLNETSQDSLGGDFSIVSYDLHFKPDFDQHLLHVEGKISFKKNTHNERDIISLLLYRMLEMKGVYDINGSVVKYDQEIKSFEDWKKLQVNQVKIQLSQPLAIGDTVTLDIDYHGYLEGYAESGMLYVKDKVRPEFTIIRPDAYAYPVIGVTSSKANRESGLPKFSYQIKTTVPDTLSVVMGGKLINKLNHNNLVTYEFKNIVPAWRFDVIIGKYQYLGDDVEIYYLEGDSLGAQTVLNYAENALNLYSNWWGSLDSTEQFSIIELPQGYGSQADVNAILQSESVFNDAGQMREVYHELSHLWDPEPEGPSNRWNEGLATFIEYYTDQIISQDSSLTFATNWYLDHLRKKLREDPHFATTPFSDFYNNQLTGYSYSLGMIFFHLIYSKLGDAKFHQVVGGVRYNHMKTGISDDDFMNELIQSSNGELRKIVNDWYYSLAYQKYIENKYTMIEIVNDYK